MKEKYKWLLIPYNVNTERPENKDIRIYLLLDNEHFSRNGNIELLLSRYEEKFKAKMQIKGYVV